MRDYVNSTALQEYTTKLVAKLKTLFPGTPTAAATVADMTDHSKTYVYVGSETGYTAGDWYYWDGTAWTSGGPFQATSIITDTTLAVAGEAADAKATGDAIAAAKAAVLNAMAPAYSTSATYAVGDYVNYNGSIYRCTTAITTAESWTAGHWTAVVLGADLASQVSDLKTQLSELNEEVLGISDEYTGNITASPTKLAKTTIIDDILIPAGTIFTLALTTTPDTPGEAMFTGALTVYYDKDSTLGTYYPDRAEPYTVTAPADIHSLQIYKATISASGTINASVAILTEESLLSRIEAAEDDINALNGLQTTVSGLVTSNDTIADTLYGDPGFTETGSLSVSSGILAKTTIIDNIEIKSGQTFTLEITTTPDTPGTDMFSGALTVYYDTNTTLGTYYPDTEEPYTVTAPADITSLQIYKSPIDAAGTITMQIIVPPTTDKSLVTQTEQAVTALFTQTMGANGSISVSGSKLNKTLLVDDIFIPADTEFRITVNATEGVIASGAVTLYYKDKDGNYGTAQQFMTAYPGETYTRIAPADMYAIYAYKTTISASGTISAELEWDTVSVESRLQDLDKAGELPEYYNDTGYIQAKSNRITELAQSCVGNGLVFAFVTDEHWNYNAKHSPVLLRYLYEHTHLPVLINGGDSGNGVRVDAIDKYRTYFPGKMYNVPGNHDWYNGNAASGMNKVYYAFDMFNNDQVTGNAMEHYYYVDNVQQKIRFIMLNAFLWDSENPTTAKTGYNADQLAWLTGEALTAPVGWDYIVFTHYIGTTTRDTTPEGVGNFRNALDAYNAHSSHTGKVLAIIQGHGHYDAVYHTAGGIPIVLVTCDKYYPFVRTVDGVTTDMEPWISEYRILGTRTEQAFDVFVLDRENRKFTAVRIGCPAMDNVDVEITDDTHFDYSPTLEEREVSYAGLYPGNP